MSRCLWGDSGRGNECSVSSETNRCVVADRQGTAYRNLRDHDRQPGPRLGLLAPDGCMGAGSSRSLKDFEDLKRSDRVSLGT